MGELTQKQLLLGQILTDLSSLNTEGQEEEINLIISKVTELKGMVETEEAEEETPEIESQDVSEDTPPEDLE